MSEANWDSERQKAQFSQIKSVPESETSIFFLEDKVQSKLQFANSPSIIQNTRNNVNHLDVVVLFSLELYQSETDVFLWPQVAHNIHRIAV